MSYRVQMVLSVLSLLVAIAPLYLIAGALQPVMADAIRAEGGQYFGFVLVGAVAFQFLTTATGALPGEVASDLRTGTLEAVLSTPARMPEVFVGLLGFAMLWTVLRALVVLLVGWGLGAPIAWARLPAAMLVVALLVLAYLPFGLIGSALIIAFRTMGPLAQAVLYPSALLGGVYYPTHVIPSWLQEVSGLLPLTYGLRALRRMLLEGLPLRAVSPDLAILSAFAVVLCGVGTLALGAALRYARRAGTLAQY
jgi:ABC-2 type transport system permease protein